MENEILKKMIDDFKVGIYIRLSKEDDNLGESESIQNQKKLLINYVNDNGYNLIDIYIDDGYTGTNFNRPSFMRMIKDIENKKINMVITKDLSRLSRDYIGTGEYVEKWFPLHNVRYVALTDNIDTFLDNSNNDIAPFKAILNDMYAKDLSKKIRTALHTMQCEGKWVGGCPPFGYKIDCNDKNHLVIDEKESLIVKRIFSMFLNGIRINKIKDILNKEKVETFSITRKRNFYRNGSNGNINGYWSSITIKKILKNRLYTGDMVQNRRQRLSYKYRKIICNPVEKWIVVENTHDAIIDKKTFNKVQELIPKQHQRNDKKELFLLDGLLKCADCNHNIGIRTRRANGKCSTVCNYYRKNYKDIKLCTSHGFDYNNLELGVLEEINKIINNLNENRIIELVLKKYYNSKNLVTYLKLREKRTLELNNLKNNLDLMYIDKLQNKISDEMYERIYKRINIDIFTKSESINRLNDLINKYNINEDNLITQVKLIINKYKNSFFNRDLILKFIKNIYVHEDGNIDIHFNFMKLNDT